MRQFASRFVSSSRVDCICNFQKENVFIRSEEANIGTRQNYQKTKFDQCGYAFSYILLFLLHFQRGTKIYLEHLLLVSVHNIRKEAKRTLTSHF